MQNRDLRREVSGLRDAMGQAAEERAGFERRIEEERARIAAVDAAAVQALREELGTTREQLATLESERAAGERIIRTYGNGVCLIQGSYGFADEAGRALRYESVTEAGENTGTPSVDGTGGPFTVDYYGTGFLVDAAGHVLTNRHVAEPWWNDGGAEELAARGFEPRFIRLRAFFPQQGEALPLTRVRLSETADLALLRVPMAAGRSIPHLPLETESSRAVAGQPVVVVGYPTGLEAILAKAESGVVKAILDSHGTDNDRVTDALSRKGLIRPSTTQGHIGDITGSDIVFDAPSAQGGSGGPVFNKHGQVIAVEYAVLPKFGGNSFGVPIAYAHELIRAAGLPAR
jgi:S1-C subfamily serine protease